MQFDALCVLEWRACTSLSILGNSISQLRATRIHNSQAQHLADVTLLTQSLSKRDARESPRKVLERAYSRRAALATHALDAKRNHLAALKTRPRIRSINYAFAQLLNLHAHGSAREVSQTTEYENKKYAIHCIAG